MYLVIASTAHLLIAIIGPENRALFLKSQPAKDSTQVEFRKREKNPCEGFRKFHEPIIRQRETLVTSEMEGQLERVRRVGEIAARATISSPFGKKIASYGVTPAIPLLLNQSIGLKRAGCQRHLEH
ncbi:MAG: hypothetical protein L0177_00655, partial [Chloroflexi bacterium]|nr:hypothetical protein [Chloroflexota bacterium]